MTAEKPTYSAYGRIPKQAFTDERLSDRAVRLLGWLDDQAGFKDDFSYLDLAAILRCSRSSARRAVDELVDAEYLKLASQMNGTGQQANAFCLVSGGCSPVSRGVTSEQGGWSPVDRGVVTSEHPSSKETRPSTRQSETKAIAQPPAEQLPMLIGLPTPKPAPADDRFDEFWSTYPRKTGKGAARKSWTKALKSETADTIIAAARKFARQRMGSDQQFTPHPATWLNQERWADEDAPATRSVAQVVETSGWGSF